MVRGALGGVVGGALCVVRSDVSGTLSEFAEDHAYDKEASTTGDEPERIVSQRVEVSEVSCNSSSDCKHGESERSCRRRSEAHPLMLLGPTWHVRF